MCKILKMQKAKIGDSSLDLSNKLLTEVLENMECIMSGSLLFCNFYVSLIVSWVTMPAGMDPASGMESKSSFKLGIIQPFFISFL